MLNKAVEAFNNIAQCEIEGIAERLLYNAYVEGYTEATKRISYLSFELISKGLPVKTEQMMLVDQIENTLWSKQ